MLDWQARSFQPAGIIKMSVKISRKDLLSSSDCLSFNLRLVSEIVSQTYDTFMSESGLRDIQFAIMMKIAKHESILLSELADELHMDRTTLMRQLIPLENLDLLSLTSTGGYHIRSTQLTETGMDALKLALPLWKKAQKYMREQLGEQRTTNLLEELQTMSELTESAQSKT